MLKMIVVRGMALGALGSEGRSCRHLLGFRFRWHGYLLEGKEDCRTGVNSLLPGRLYRSNDEKPDSARFDPDQSQHNHLP